MDDMTREAAIELYHVSEEAYLIGTALQPLSSQSRFQARQHKLGNDWLEAEFETRRLSTMPSRLTCRFAFSGLGECSAFAGAEQRGSGTLLRPRYYRVNAGVAHRAPMTLVGRAAKHRLNAVYLDEIIAEYWSSTKDWKFHEYLCPSFTVVEEVPTPEEAASAEAYDRFMDDFWLANALWP